MKFVLFIMALFIATVLGMHTILQNGSLATYLDTHPNPDVVPPVEYYIGEGYYLFSDLQNSATFYQRLIDHYPQSGYSDDAYFNYLQDLDDMGTPRLEMAEKYAAYVERFPTGSHLDVVQKRIEYCRNNR